MLVCLTVQPVYASMVIAPSTIVINANENASQENLRNNRVSEDDNTGKAIIGYVLDGGCRVIDDATHVNFSVFPSYDGEYIEALSIRYCYVDSNLIIEFDRNEVTNYLDSCLEPIQKSGDIAELAVSVAGSFMVSCDGVTIVKEIPYPTTATILISVKNKRR